jgi:general secretion pathway protein I
MTAAAARIESSGNCGLARSLTASRIKWAKSCGYPRSVRAVRIKLSSYGGFPRSGKAMRIKLSRNCGYPRSVHATRGYTLLEVLVAFTLLAIGLGLLLAILSGGVRSIGRSAQSTQATLYAQGLLDSLGADRRLQPGRSQGDFERGNYRWTLDIERFQPPVPPPAPGDVQASPPNLQNVVENLIYRVELRMQWGARGSEQSLRVETLRAYVPPQAGAR